MTPEQIKSNPESLLDYMKEHGFPVFHKSNIFLRDFQYAVRDFVRATTKKDPGTRISDATALEVVAALERNGQLKPLNDRTWILYNEKYLLTPEPEEEEVKEESDEAAA